MIDRLMLRRISSLRTKSVEEDKLILVQAELCGYEGSCPEEAYAYIEAFHEELQRISEASWRRFCNLPQEAPIDRSFYVRDFIAQETLNVSEFYRLLIGREAHSWEVLSQYLLKRCAEGSVTDYEDIAPSLKSFCFHLTASLSQRYANDLLGRLGAAFYPVNWNSREVQVLLWDALHHGRLDIVRCFLAFGFDRHILLQYAVEQGQLDLVEYLLGGEVASDELLRSAIEGEHEMLASYLVYQGACLEQKLGQETFLTHYVYARRLPSLQLLLRLGARVDASNDAGKTPLMCALEQGYEDVACLLLQHDESLKTSEGELLFVYYAKQENLDAIRMLIHLGIYVEAEVLDVAQSAIFPVVQSQIEQQQTYADFLSIAGS